MVFRTRWRSIKPGIEVKTPLIAIIYSMARDTRIQNTLSITRCFLLCRLEHNREKNSFSQNGFSQSKQTFTVSAASSIVKIEDQVKLHLKMPTAFLSNIKLRGPAFDERKPHSFCLLSAILKRAFLPRGAREKRRRNFLEKI